MQSRRCVGALAAVAAVLAPAVQALYGADGAVELLDEPRYGAIGRDALPYLVEFYAPWCGHCKTLAPEFAKAAEKVRGMVGFGAVDCDQAANQALCAQHDIKGFPTIKIVLPLGDGRVSTDDYAGQRTAASLIQSAQSLIPDHVLRVGDAELEGFLEQKNGTAKAILFTDKAEPSYIYRGLSNAFRERVLLAQVHTSQTSAMDMFNVKRVPSLLFLPGGAATEPVMYNGQISYPELKAFLESSVSAKFQDDTASKPEASSSGPSQLYSVVHAANLDEFASTCLSTKSACLISLDDDDSNRRQTRSVFDALCGKPTFQQIKFVMAPSSVGDVFEKLVDWTAKPRILYLNSRKGWVGLYGDSVQKSSLQFWVDDLRTGQQKKTVLQDNWTDFFQTDADDHDQNPFIKNIKTEFDAAATSSQTDFVDTGHTSTNQEPSEAAGEDNLNKETQTDVPTEEIREENRHETQDSPGAPTDEEGRPIAEPISDIGAPSAQASSDGAPSIPTDGKAEAPVDHEHKFEKGNDTKDETSQPHRGTKTGSKRKKKAKKSKKAQKYSQKKKAERDAKEEL